MYVYGGLHHQSCWEASYLGFCFAYKLNSMVHLENLELCITGKPKDGRTRGVHNIPLGMDMACDVSVAIGVHLIGLS